MLFFHSVFVVFVKPIDKICWADASVNVNIDVHV